MTREIDECDEFSDESSFAISFTARLNAYYRAIESKLKTPLIIDPFAEQLAGDLTDYFKIHPRFTGMGGSQIARSYYIENELLVPWCGSHKTSQIVLLGAGLDTRAYRIKPLAQHSHSIFEIDLPSVIKYKERILQDEKPLCNLIRLSSDLSQPHWISDIRKSGFSKSIPTFWILEGLVYYLEKNHVYDLLKTLSEMSMEGSQLFVDVCVPALADLKWGPFTDFFKWGIPRDEVPSFFASSGWRVSFSFLDTHAHGKDVGQRGLILVHGSRDTSGINQAQSLGDNSSRLIALDIQKFSHDFIPRIEELIKLNTQDTRELLTAYTELIESSEDDLQTIAKSQEKPVLLGLISPRLLGNPLSIIDEFDERTDEEIQSFIISNLQAVLKLVYCGVKGIQATEYKDTLMEKESRKLAEVSGPESLTLLLVLLKQELDL